MTFFKSICLSGGGVNGFAHLGALHYLYTTQSLKFVETFIGTSIGALIAFLYCIGITPISIYDNLKFLDGNTCFQMGNHKYGLDSGEYFIAKIIDILITFKVSPLLTFQQLFETYKKKLVICATNVYKHIPIYFNKDDHPDMRIIDAIRITTCIPFLFTPITLNGDLYIDGFLTDNYPINYTINYTKENGGSIDDVLGIHVKSSTISVNNDSFDNYIYNLLCCFKNKSNNIIAKTCTISIDTKTMSVHFTIDLDQRDALFKLGEEEASKYLQLNKRINQRRHSF